MADAITGVCRELWDLFFLGEGKGEEGEKLTKKTEEGKAHSKQNAVCNVTEGWRCICLGNGVAGTQEAWKEER